MQKKCVKMHTFPLKKIGLSTIHLTISLLLNQTSQLVWIGQSVWELDDDMVCYDNDRAYPGLIVMANFFKDIKHKGSKDYYE